jgi:hypothetical protein
MKLPYLLDYKMNSFYSYCHFEIEGDLKFNKQQKCVKNQIVTVSEKIDFWQPCISQNLKIPSVFI